MYDFVIVGAGLAGCTLAKLLSDKNKRVLIIEKRNHIGGNLFDEIDRETGVIVQRYGPHIFHTNDEEVYKFIVSISQWEDFVVSCGAEINGVCTPSPFNFKTIDQFYDEKKAQELKNALLSNYPFQNTVTIVELLESKVSIIKEYADFLYNEDYSLYTAKQWGINPSEVDINVLKRVPVRLDYCEQYFTDKYQLMPKNGFSSFINKLIDSPLIDIVCGKDAREYISFNNNKIDFKYNECENASIIWTGPIDSLFDYEYGLLPYRSLEFKYQYINQETYQKYPVVAYPKAHGYTRITDFSTLPIQKKNKTIIAYEYPKQYSLDMNTDPYYPINNTKNQNQYNKYLIKAKKITNLFLLGRLAMYKYYNMDQVIKESISLFKKIVNVDEGR